VFKRFFLRLFNLSVYKEGELVKIVFTPGYLEPLDPGWPNYLQKRGIIYGLGENDVSSTFDVTNVASAMVIDGVLATIASPRLFIKGKGYLTLITLKDGCILKLYLSEKNLKHA
jgi:hypothetical protein